MKISDFPVYFKLSHRLLLFFAAISLIGFSISAQSLDAVFHRPMNIPPLLSATFGELRDGHLHSGIDYRTQGSIGHRIFACEDGFVSRISVSPSGYGKALYIDHPNGYTTVYAHLDAFSEKIEAYVKAEQYRLERFTVNLFPNEALFSVKRGEIVGFSGNTGSSSGPHLHFEVRNTETQDPINPLKFGFGIGDNIPPTMRRLAVYPAGEGSTVNGSETRIILELEKVGNTFRIAGGTKIDVVGDVAFGIEAYDMTSGSNIRCGLYRIRLSIDTLLMFSQTMDRFSFDETRYVYSALDYEYFINNRTRINRMYIQPNNQLSVYDQHVNRGIISFPDTASHRATVVISDFHGNDSRLNFDINYIPSAVAKTSNTPGLLEPISFTGISTPMYKREFVHRQHGIRVTIPADALYYEIEFTSNVSTTIPGGLFSKIYSIHNPNTPLHKAITIEIDAENLPSNLREKALITQIGANGRRSNAGGAYRDGVVSTTSRVFGQFAIGIDTVPPRITPVNIRDGANMRGVESIRFTISDNFSGIGSYNGWINGEWVLFEYDAKNNLIFYRFDEARLSRNAQHELLLIVADSKGNSSEFRASFTW